MTQGLRFMTHYVLNPTHMLDFHDWAIVPEAAIETPKQN